MGDGTAEGQSVRSYGASGDGEERDTEAIQDALDACSRSGGTVLVPPGDYLTAPLRVGDDTTLHLEAGATLQFVGEYEAYPDASGRWEGWNQVGFHPCLRVASAENVSIEGRGTIDGGGEYWWELHGRTPSAYPEGLRDRLASFRERNDTQDAVSEFTLRPPLLQIYQSENVTISGITVQNSPFWNTHVVYSRDVTIHDITVRNPEHAPNGDGIDIDSSQHVRISDTSLNAGDDAICIKSGKDAEGREIGLPASGITVTNCTVEAGHGGVVIGSEMSGDVRDVTVSNCTFRGTDRGIRIKTQRGRGGVVEDLRFDSIVMRDVACPFVVNGYYFTDITSEPAPVDDGTPLVRNVHIHDVTATNVETAGFLAGLPVHQFVAISFENVRIDATRPLDTTDLTPAMADGYEQRHALFCTSLADVSFSNVSIQTQEGPSLIVEDTETLEIDSLRTPGSASAPVLTLTDVGRTYVRGCIAPANGRFATIDGRENELVSVAGNHGDLREAFAVIDGGRVSRWD